MSLLGSLSLVHPDLVLDHFLAVRRQRCNKLLFLKCLIEYFVSTMALKGSLESLSKTVVLKRERREESRMYIPSGLWIWAVLEQWWYICTHSVIWKLLLNEEFYNKCFCLVQWPFPGSLWGSVIMDSLLLHAYKHYSWIQFDLKVGSVSGLW